MSLLVYKFSDYEHTAEREQYRSLCKQLKSYYENREDICIFIANYNANDCELDGLLIKQDAIMVVEFKNYEGTVIAVENGQWKLHDGTTIKGGSKKSVYQQAKLNHIAVKQDFEYRGITPTSSYKDVAALVVFHQPINVVNRLSAKTKSWLHLADENTFMEKVQDITSKNTDFSKEDMFSMVDKLMLSEEYLDRTFSSDFSPGLTYSDETNIIETEELTCDVEQHIENDQETSCISCNSDSQILSLTTLAREVLTSIGLDDTFSINVYNAETVRSMIPNIELTREMIVIVQGQITQDITDSLKSFLQKPIICLGNLLYWEEGLLLNNRKMETLQVPESNNCIKDITLPNWVDELIFNKFHAIYEPDYKKFEYNLDLTSQDILVYLGTYFPRSFSEQLYILEQLDQKTSIITTFQFSEEIKVLDFGCGVGGELFGLLCFLNSRCPWIKKVSIWAIDGNHDSLRTLESLVSNLNGNIGVKVELKICPIVIKNAKDIETAISIIGGTFDFILSFKAIGELIAKGKIEGNAYNIIASLLCPQLSPIGIAIIEDVTVKKDVIETFLPNYMNRGIDQFLSENNQFEDVLPTACNRKKNDDFSQDTLLVSHTHCPSRATKFAYRCIRKIINT